MGKWDDIRVGRRRGLAWGGVCRPPGCLQPWKQRDRQDEDDEQQDEDEQSDFLPQPFVHDPSKTVTQVLKEAESKAGKPVTIKSFVRYALGEGIEKEEAPDFASEVAAQAGLKKA